MSSDNDYKYTREEIVQMVIEEYQRANRELKTIVSLARPNSQTQINSHFIAKKAAYHLVLEMLTEVHTNDEEAGENPDITNPLADLLPSLLYDETAGENGHIVHHPPASTPSPAFTPQTEPEAQEVI
jgi:hypothetical protein